METSTYYPYRTEEARDTCFAYIDALAASQWPISSEERTVPTAFGPTFVRISGPPDAPPLVLLHGASTTSLMWAPNIEALSVEYRTFAVDQVGEFGRSLCTRPMRRFDELFTWLNDLLDGLELRGGVNMAGMSYGGALAAHYALHFPDRLNKVVLLAPGATVLRLNSLFMARLMLSAVAKQKALPSLMRWMFADIARKDPKWMDAALDLIFTNMRNVQPHWPVIPKVLTDAEWGSLRVPALFLVGEHEKIYPAEKAVRRLQRVAPLVSAEIIPGAGHDLTFVQAALVNQKIVAFLKQPAASKVAGAFAG